MELGQLDRARREWQRIQAVSADAVSQSSRDAAQTAVKQAEAGLKQAQEQYAVAQQNIINTGVGREGAQAGIANAQALLDLAKQDLGHTVIYAPASGKLGEVSVKQGQLVSAGTQLMSVVPPERWIIANIKETDMANVKIGQSASVSIDALGGKAFSGKVAEISPATASEFSLIKADSGTGNEQSGIQGGISELGHATADGRDVLDRVRAGEVIGDDRGETVTVGATQRSGRTFQGRVLATRILGALITI